MINITSFLCWPDYKAGKYLLSWEAEGTEPVTFRIRHAFLPDAPTTTIAEELAGFAYEASIDDAPLNFSEDVHFWIDAVSDTTGDVVATVGPVSDSHVPERRHFLYHREVLRRTELDISRYMGARIGYLLRKKMYGEVAESVNPILGMPIGQEDKTSFGEKYDFGYHPPVSMMCGYTDERGDPQQLKTVELGDTDARRLRLTTTFFPPLKVGDVWVNGDSNDRYKILVDARTILFRNLPVKQVAILSLLPRTDRVYEIQVP